MTSVDNRHPHEPEDDLYIVELKSENGPQRYAICERTRTIGPDDDDLPREAIEAILARHNLRAAPLPTGKSRHGDHFFSAQSTKVSFNLRIDTN